MCHNYDAGECVEPDCAGRITCHDFMDKRCAEHSINGRGLNRFAVEDDEPDEALPPYVPVERTDTLIRCQRCGAVVDGHIVGQVQHDVWHTNLDHRIEQAGRWKPAPRYGGVR